MAQADEHTEQHMPAQPPRSPTGAQPALPRTWPPAASMRAAMGAKMVSLMLPRGHLTSKSF
jgi:hypothetical protein